MTYNLRVAPELLDASLAREANTTRPFNSTTSNALGDLTGVILRHGSLLHKLLPLLLPPCRIIREQPRGLDLNCCIRHLERETLEGTDRLAELFALVRVRYGFVECPACKAEHLRGDTNATLVQDCNGNLVPKTKPANDVRRRNAQVVEVEGACRGRADTELLLFLSNLDAHVLGGEEACDALVTLARIDLSAFSLNSSAMMHGCTRTFAKMRKTSAS